MLAAVVLFAEEAVRTNVEKNELLIVFRSWYRSSNTRKEPFLRLKNDEARKRSCFIGFRTYWLVPQTRIEPFSVQNSDKAPWSSSERVSILELFFFPSTASIALRLLKH